jgi:hypothetical protein
MDRSDRFEDRYVVRSIHHYLCGLLIYTDRHGWGTPSFALSRLDCTYRPVSSILLMRNSDELERPTYR